MQITSLSAQKNNPKRVNLFVDEKFLTGISLQLVVENKLRVGMEIDEESLKNLLLKIFRENLFDLALNFLTFRPRSEKELKIYLQKKIKDVLIKSKLINDKSLNSDKLIEDICLKLKDLGQIDDKKFIKWWILQRQAFRGKSQRIITMELWQKGIDKKLVDEVRLENNNDFTTDLDIAKKLGEKRLSRYAGLEPKDKKEKIYSFLAQRGFSYEIIEDVIDIILKKD